MYIMYIMSEDFEFFSNDFNNWNYNEMFIKPDIDPFNNNKKLTLSAVIYINIIELLCQKKF